MKLSDALPEVGSKMLYRYDFGDNWEHSIELEQILDPQPGERYPICIDGARACRREDCGGVGGYEELLEAFADSDREEHEEMRMWAGENWDPEKFDCFAVNLGLPRRVIVKTEQTTKRRTKSNRGDREEGGRTWMSDLTHFLDENGLPPVDAPQELHEALGFFVAVTQAGSSHLDNNQFCSTVLCRNDRSSKPCGGHLMISRRPDGVIHWHCPKCREQGYISNWQGTTYDLSDTVEPDPAQRVSVLVTRKEYELLGKITTTSREENAIISGTVSTPDGVLLNGGFEGFELLLGSIAATANHEDDVRLQRAMDRAYGKFERLIEG